MKKLQIYSTMILISLTALSFQGCSKKGEDDPALSLKSRDTRLAGSWTLSAMNETSTSTTVRNGKRTTTTTSKTYSGNEETTTPSSGKPTTRSYELKLTIEKDGSIRYTFEAFDTDGVSTGVSTVEGTWNWTTAGKRKSGINIDIAGNTIPSMNGNWDVRQLKNKEIVFAKSLFAQASSNNIETESSGETSLTFTGK